MNICITGGGTGGHLSIAAALLEASKSKMQKIIFIGSTSGQDRKYFEKESDFQSVYFLNSRGVVNQKGFAKLSVLAKIFQAFLEARRILKDEKIDVVYSVGGFSAAPASFAALSLKIPLFIHEQNAKIGRLNALLKPFSKRFISAYEKDSPINGYPIKEVFFQQKHIRKELKTIIFLGGSHGAKAINDFALEVVPLLKTKGINVIHQTGEFDFKRIEKKYKDMGVEVELYSFTSHLDQLIVKADLAVSRAGASTLWELTSNGCVAFYVPYPYAAGDHQYFNAQFIVQNNMGWCVRENEDLKNIFLSILDEDLESRSRKLITYAQENVAEKMIEDIKLCLEN